MIEEHKYQVYLNFMATLMSLGIEKRLSYSDVDGKIAYKLDSDYSNYFILWRDKWLGLDIKQATTKH